MVGPVAARRAGLGLICYNMCGTECFEDIVRSTSDTKLDAVALQGLPDGWKGDIKGKWQVKVAEEKVVIRRCGLMTNTHQSRSTPWRRSQRA